MSRGSALATAVAGEAAREPQVRLHHNKREAQKQWDSNPCGANTVASEQPESSGFYRAARDHRPPATSNTTISIVSGSCSLAWPGSGWSAGSAGAAGA